MAKRKGTQASGQAKRSKGSATTKGASTAEATLLSKLMEQHEIGGDGISFATILKDLGMNDRNTGWRNTWKDLIKLKYIEPTGSSGAVFTSEYRLTETGVELAATDEYKQARAAAAANQPKTTEELHNRIKKKLMNNRAVQIFDLLHERGSLTRTELSGILGISDRGAPFSYGLKQLKKLGYVDVDEALSSHGNKKLRLTSTAYLLPKQPSKEDSVEVATSEASGGDEDNTNEIKKEVFDKD